MRGTNLSNSVPPSAELQQPALNSQDFEDFVYLISHDVRSSVRALIELPQWIADDLADAGVKVDGSLAENIELMNRHTGRLDRMLVDLLTFSRVGRMQTRRDVDLDEALNEVLDEIVVPPNFRLHRRLDCRVLPLGDRDVLNLLTALISNAIKHHDRKIGEVTVASRREGDRIILTVSDDGPGIEPQFRERVFGAMTTLRPRDEVEGSGMGLAIVRKIARVYQGGARILDAGCPGGTTVEVWFPVASES